MTERHNNIQQDLVDSALTCIEAAGKISRLYSAVYNQRGLCLHWFVY